MDKFEFAQQVGNVIFDNLAVVKKSYDENDGSLTITVQEKGKEKTFVISVVEA